METIAQALSQGLPGVIEDSESQPYKGQSSPESFATNQTFVEKLLEQLALVYGSARMASHWKDLNPEAIQALWGRKLANMPRRNVGYAMANLPTDFPPSVDEFLAIARRCPPPTFKALPHMPSAEEVQRNRERIAALAARFGSKAHKADGIPDGDG